MEGNFKIVWDDEKYTITDEEVHAEELPIKHNVRTIGAMLCNLLKATTRKEMLQHSRAIHNQVEGLIERLEERF